MLLRTALKSAPSMMCIYIPHNYAKSFLYQWYHDSLDISLILSRKGSKLSSYNRISSVQTEYDKYTRNRGNEKSPPTFTLTIGKGT